MATPAAIAAGPGGGAIAPLADHRVPPDPDADPALRAAKEAQRQLAAERRQRPSARERRRDSRDAYRDLTRHEAVDLAQESFPALNQRAYKALDLSAGERVAAWLGDRAARVDRGPAQPDLFVESQLPLRTVDAAGRPTPVDLSLRDVGDSFKPLAPLVSLEVHDEADEGIRLDDIDVAVKPVGVEDVAGVAAQDKAFFPEAAADTDYVVTPLPAGVDLGAQLRSPASPERFRWRVDLPDDARLQLSTTAPGAEIIAADGAKLAHITAPVAWDADDNAVNATLAIEGADLVVDVAHRGQDVRYPVMLDPTILEDRADWFASYAGLDLSGWHYSDPTGRFPYFYGNAFLGNGLYSYSRGTKYFNAGDYANWYFNAPGTSRIVRVEFGHVKHDPQTTGSFAAPYNDDRVYEGVWSYQLGRYERGSWCEPAEAGGACGTSPFSTYGALNYNTKTHFDLEATPGNAAIFGTSVYFAGNHASFTSFLGSASVWIEDATPPAVTEDSGLSDSSWTSYRAFQGRAADSGLGLKTLTLDSPGNPNWTGRYLFDAGCTGDRRSRCPQGAFARSDSSALPEGVVPVRFKATDAVGNLTERTWTLRIDRSGPRLEKPADDGRDLTLEDRKYEATVVARDEHSGVRSIDFALHDESGRIVEDSPDPEPQGCEQGCEKTRTWGFDPQYLEDGRYTVSVTATDQLGIATEDSWVVEIGRGIPPTIRRT